MDLSINWTHPEILRFFKNIEESEKNQELQKVIEVGCTILNRIQLQADSDFIEKRIAEISGDVSKQLQHFYHTTQTRIDEFERQIGGQLKASDSSSFAGQLHKLVGDHFGPNGITEKQLTTHLGLDLDAKNGLGQIYRAIRTELQELRDEMMKNFGSQQTIAKTTLKGYPFEEKVWEKLNALAKPYGDMVSDVSKKVEAVSGSKKGDYVYDLGDTKDRIVIDAKNYNQLSSLPAMLSYLDEAMLQRSCGFGIIVAPEAENLQKQIGTWNVYDQRIITTLDNLEISIKFARFTMRCSQASSEGVAVGAIVSRLENIERKMKDISTIKTKLVKLSNGVTETIEDSIQRLDNLRKDV